MDGPLGWIPILTALATAGAAAGAAVAYWRHGKASVLTGALIGAICLPVAGSVGVVWAGAMAILGMIGLIAAVLAG